MNIPTFNQWVTENSGPPGNYLSIGCESPDIKEIKTLRSGKEAGGDSHITVMYSTETSLDPEKLYSDLSPAITSSYANVIGFDCFDGSDKGEETGCIVAKLDCPLAEQLHQTLQVVYGLKHSYPTFSAHVTLAYDVDIIEARNITALLNEKYRFVSMTLTTGELKSESIDKDWSDKL